MKLGGRCIAQKSRPSWNVGSWPPWVLTLQKCGVGLRRWENQRRLSSVAIAFLLLYASEYTFRTSDSLSHLTYIHHGHGRTSGHKHHECWDTQ